MFESTHKNHEFEHLKKVFDTDVKQVQDKIKEFHEKIKKMDDGVKEINNCVKCLKDCKMSKMKDIKDLYQKTLDKVENEYKLKLKTLNEKKEVLIKNYNEFKNELDKIQIRMTTLTNVEIVQHSEEIKVKLDKLNAKKFEEFKKDNSIFDFNSNKLMSFSDSTFILKNFSSYRNKEDVIYSDPMIIDGISWRLKVYPNGNKPVIGNYLSVFVEMYKGWYDRSGFYEYRVELIHRENKSKMITREFISNFETSVSWGYNKFCRLDSLESEGFLNITEDLVIFVLI